MFANLHLQVPAFRTSLGIVLVAMLLAAGALSFSPVRADAASCRAFVNDASYGNDGGYAYSHAVANCDGDVSATLYATIVDAGGGWLASSGDSGYGSYFSSTVSGHFCATLAPGYAFTYDGSGGNLYPLWTC